MIFRELTTGQAAGLAQVPLKTMQRYIRDFREFFSPGAAQPTRGRRFIEADIYLLYSIRHLYNQRKSTEEIREELAKGKPPLDFPKFTIMDDLAVSQATRDYMDTAKAHARKAELQANKAQCEASRMANTNQRFKDVIERIDTKYPNRREIRQLQADVQALTKEIEHLKRSLVEQPKSLIDRVFGF